LPIPSAALVVIEAMILEWCKAGHFAQLRRWGKECVCVRTCQPLAAALVNGDLDLMRCLVKELGVNIHQRDVHGLTPLHIAALHGKIGIMRCLHMLVEFGADVNQQDNSGATATFYAADVCRLNELRCLVREFGADINHSSHDGETALMAAAQAKHAALIKWLVKAGADPQAKNAAQMNAADISRRLGSSPGQIAYLEAKAHCASPGSSGAGTKKCQGDTAEKPVMWRTGRHTRLSAGGWAQFSRVYGRRAAGGSYERSDLSVILD
jgi:hypothetical protein